jgi:hypothetical protein
MWNIVVKVVSSIVALCILNSTIGLGHSNLGFRFPLGVSLSVFRVREINYLYMYYAKLRLNLQLFTPKKEPLF